MNKWIEILVGLIILNGIILFGWYSAELGSFWNFRHATWEFFKGGLIWFIAMIGLLLIVLGINDIKE
jgi:hypothetical protein